MTFTHQPAAALGSDADLLGFAAKGDERSFRAFYDRHVGAIRGYALGRVGPDAADDIVSESFSVAWSLAARFDPDSDSARPWLYGIATKVMSRHRESEHRWMQQQQRQPEADRVDDAGPIAFELDPALARGIARLSPALRDTLLLTALGDLSVAETARALGITATTARVRLLRARRIVRQSLEGASS